MAELIGVVSGVIGIVSPAISQIEQLVDRCQNFRAAPAEFRNLRNDCKTVRNSIQRLERDVQHFTLRVPEDIQRFKSDADAVKNSFKNAEYRCQIIRKYFPTRPPDASVFCGCLLHWRQAFLRFIFAGRIARECEHISNIVRDANADGTALNRFLHIAVQFKHVQNEVKQVGASVETVGVEVSVVDQKVDTILQIAEESTANAKDDFEPRHYVPDLSRKIILDFFTCDAEDRPVTMEGKLKRALLDIDSRGEFSRLAVAVAARGMGGVGKTNALLGLGWNKDVRERFKIGGIYFLSFGKDAGMGDVIEQLALAVEASGGVRRANDIRASKTLRGAIMSVVSWFGDRETLFLCDDMWETAENSVGHFNDLKQLLTSRGRIHMVLSTRDRRIADAAGKSIEFGPRTPEGKLSRAILLNYAAISEEVVTRSSDQCHKAMRKILCTCGGVPLTLAVAGRAVQTTARNCRNGDDGLLTALVIYAEKLEINTRGMMTEDIEGYPNFCLTVRTSLDMADQWAQKKGISREAAETSLCSDLFTRMNVFPRQSRIPRNALKKLWSDVDNDDVNRIIDKLVDLNLLSKREDRENALSVGLHDLVLEYCVIQAGRDARRYHFDFMGHYLTKDKHAIDETTAVGDDALDKVSNTIESRPWWSLSSDGHFPENVCWHLWKGGCVDELMALLFDVRWTMFRMGVGGLLGWKNDFESLKDALIEKKKDNGYEDDWDSVEAGVRLVREAVNESWGYLKGNERELGMQVHSRLFDVDERVWPVRRYLQSVRAHCGKPWLLPLGRYWPRPAMGASVELLVGVDVGNIAITNDGSLVAGTQGKEVLIVDVQLRSVVKRLAGHRKDVTSVCLSENGSMLVSGSEDGTLRRWDPRTGAAMGEPLCGHNALVLCVAMSADGTVIMSGASDGTLRRWNGRTGAVIGEPLSGHNDRVQCVAMSADGAMIVSGSGDGTLRRWNGRTGAVMGEPLRGHKGRVLCVAVSGDGAMIVSGSEDRTLRRWDGRSGSAMGEPLRGHDGEVSCVALTQDDMIISGSVDRTLRRWNGRTGAVLGEPLHGHDDWIRCIAMSEDGSMIMSRSLDKTLCRWDGTTGMAMSNPLREHAHHASCLAMSEDGTIIVSGSEDGKLRRWDGRTGAPMGDPLCGHEDQVDCVAISADGAIIVSASHETVRLWDAQTGTAIGLAVLRPSCKSINIENDFVLGRTSNNEFIRWKIDRTCGLVDQEELDRRTGWSERAVRSGARDASFPLELWPSSHQLIWGGVTGLHVLATLLSPVSVVEYKRVSFRAGGTRDDDESSYTVGAVVAVILRNQMFCVFHLVIK